MNDNISHLFQELAVCFKLPIADRSTRRNVDTDVTESTKKNSIVIIILDPNAL